MASNAIVKECGVCNEEFDEEARCPRIFQCLHTLCTFCIDQLISNDKKKCPFCRTNFNANCSEDITVNHLAIELIKYISVLNSSTKMSHKDQVLPRKKRIEDLKKETRETSSFHFVNCQEAKKQIEKTLKEVINLQKIIKEENTRIENDVLPKIQNVITQNNRTVEELERTESKLENQLKEVEVNGKKLDDVRASLDSCRAKTFSESGALLDEADDTNTAIGYWIETFKGLISEEEKTLQTNEKAIKRTGEKINIISEVLSLGEERDGEIDIIPRMAAILIQEDTQITVETLQKMSPQLKYMIEQGGLYAVQHRNERRCARISFAENKKLCLHHLREEPLPPNVLVIDHEEVMRLVDPSSRLTFMDLGVAGSILGRMYIFLFRSYKVSKQFCILCTGEAGPSYANSNILDYDHEYDLVRLGDYETNDGKGGKALVPGVEEEERCRDMKIKSTAAQFDIYLQTGYVRHIMQFSNSFGKVEEGLDDLSEAVTHQPNIRELYIKDCGIVLPL